MAIRHQNRHNLGPLRVLTVGLVAACATACTGRTEGTTGGTQPQPPGDRRSPANPWSNGLGQVGNQVRGIEAMPDYDEEAQALRLRVEPRLPSPLPSSKAACVTMLDVARQFYLDTEGEDSLAVRTMDATHDDDLADCTEQTNPATAACVSVLMAKSEGEFAWVLDQCRRAFAEEPSQG